MEATENFISILSLGLEVYFFGILTPVRSVNLDSKVTNRKILPTVQ